MSSIDEPLLSVSLVCRMHPASTQFTFWSGGGLLEICGQKYEMVEKDDLYFVEMERMAGIEVGTDAMEVEEENVHRKMEVSALTKINHHWSLGGESSPELPQTGNRRSRNL